MLRRLDDYLFINRLLGKSYSIVIVPGRNMLVAWLREDVDDPRIIEKKRARNGIVIVKARLSL